MGHRIGAPRAIIYQKAPNSAGDAYWSWFCPECGKHSGMSRLDRNAIKPPHRHCTGKKR